MYPQNSSNGNQNQNEDTNQPLRLSISQSPRKKLFAEHLEDLLSEIVKNTSDKDLIGSDLWKYIFGRFSQFYFQHDDKIQFLNIIKRYLEVNFEGLQKVNQNNQYEDQSYFCGQIGQKLHNVYTEIESENQTNNQIINLLVEQKLLQKTLDEVALIVSQLFEKNRDSFALLSLHMFIEVQKELKNKSFSQVNQDFLQKVKELQTKYPPSKVQQSFQRQTEIFEFFTKDQFEKEKIVFTNQKSKIEQIKEFIFQKVEKAEQDYQFFKELMTKKCQKHGYGLKTDLKIKKINGQYNISGIDRTVQKMTENLRQKNKQRLKENTKSLLRKYSGHDYSQNQFLEMAKNQIQKMQKLNQQLLDNEMQISFDVKDLVRGKCVFQKIQDLIETSNELIQYIRQKGQKIISINNRFKQKRKAKATNDLVLIIKLPNSIAQIQLALKLDSYANEFNHKLYELERSSTYSLITNLYIQNKKLCQKLFWELNDFINQKGQLTKKEKFHKLIESLINQQKLTIINNDNLIEAKEMEILEKVNQLIQEIKVKTKQTNRNDKIKNAIKKNEINLLDEFRDYKKVKDMFQKCQQEENTQYARILSIIGWLEKIEQNYDKALQFFNKSLEIYKKVNGKQSIEVSFLLNRIAIVLSNQQNYTQAMKYYKESLQIKKNIKGEFSLDVAESLTWIASSLKDQEKYVEALQYYNKGLEIQTKIKGQFSTEVANNLHNIGIIYKIQGNHAEALKYYNKCLEIKKELKGQSSLSAANIMYNIATLHKILCNYTEALKYYKKSMEIYKNIKGEQSSDMGDVLYEIAIIYSNQQNYSEALNMMEKSLQIYKNLKEQSIDVVYCLNQIGSIYKKEQNYFECLKYYLKSLQINKKLKGQQSFQVANLQYKIALVYQNEGTYNEALDYYKKSLQIFKNTKGESSSNVAETLQRIAIVYKKQGNFFQALKNYKDTLQIYRNIKGEQATEVANILFQLSSINQSMQDYQSSLQNCEKSHEIYLKIHGPQHQQTITSANKLKQLKEQILLRQDQCQII